MTKPNGTLSALSATVAIVATGFISTAAYAENDNSARRQAVIDYWTTDRRAVAIPRDLRVDNRGLGYLRRPDGPLPPYEHQIGAESCGAPTPMARPGGGKDKEPPQISNLDPPAGATIGSSYTFSGIATDNVGTCSFSLVIICPDHVTTQTFSAPNTSGDSWSTTLSGFMRGNGSRHVGVIEQDVERS